MSASSMFESLESRALYSCMTSLHGGVLSINGTNRADSICVDTKSNCASKLVVRVDGRSQCFNAAKVDTIDICGNKGNDNIDVTASVDISTDVDGGDGNDCICVAKPTQRTIVDTWNWDTDNQMIDSSYSSDSCTDTVSGGNGNDVIKGYVCTLVADGGFGNDKIYSGDGNDCVWGGGGDDVIDCGCGDDQIDGGDGYNQIDSGQGQDQVVDVNIDSQYGQSQQQQQQNSCNCGCHDQVQDADGYSWSDVVSFLDGLFS
jgi:Ca2+-binding RTX toxin-like protein